MVKIVFSGKFKLKIIPPGMHMVLENFNYFQMQCKRAYFARKFGPDRSHEPRNSPQNPEPICRFTRPVFQPGTAEKWRGI